MKSSSIFPLITISNNNHIKSSAITEDKIVNQNNYVEKTTILTSNTTDITVEEQEQYNKKFKVPERYSLKYLQTKAFDSFSDEIEHCESIREILNKYHAFKNTKDHILKWDFNKRTNDKTLFHQTVLQDCIWKKVQKVFPSDKNISFSQFNDLNNLFEEMENCGCDLPDNLLETSIPKKIVYRAFSKELNSLNDLTEMLKLWHQLENKNNILRRNRDKLQKFVSRYANTTTYTEAILELGKKIAKTIISQNYSITLSPAEFKSLMTFLDMMRNIRPMPIFDRHDEWKNAISTIWWYDVFNRQHTASTSSDLSHFAAASIGWM